MKDDYFTKLFTSRIISDRRTISELTSAAKSGEQRALATLEKLAHSGDQQAQFELGYMYAKGIGVAQNYTSSEAWYVKAACQGNLDAKYNLGIMYLKGEGVEHDYEVAMECFSRAAVMGHERSREIIPQVKELLDFIRDGSVMNLAFGGDVVSGVKNDALAARYYISLREIMKDPTIGDAVIHYIVNGRTASSIFSEVQRVVEISRKLSSVSGAPVSEILQSIVTEEGLDSLIAPGKIDITSIYNLGVMYLNGQGGVSRDLAMAHSIFLLAANRGYTSAIYNLGVMYMAGVHVEPDICEAIYWFDLAAGAGHVNAAFTLGDLYMKGQKVDQDLNKAMLYLKIAADGGHPAAQEYMKKV